MLIKVTFTQDMPLAEAFLVLFRDPSSVTFSLQKYAQGAYARLKFLRFRLRGRNDGFKA